LTTGTLPPLLGDRYRLERRVGLGGMAVVHLAHDTLLDRPVAVKVLALRFGDDEELRERFVREGRYAAKLSHPHVVAVFDTGEANGQPYIVMEYVAGASLAEELARRGPFAASEVAEVGRQAASGLAHAHARGLVHRDVKPQNLLVRSDGVLKVADFGIARSGAAGPTLTQAGTLLGTAAYMAPEVAHGEPATAAADVYSLGAVLYELLTGVPPRRVESLADLVETQPVRPAAELAPDAPPDLVATIAACLDPDPRRRPPSAAELALRLERPPASTRPTVPLQPPLRRRATRRTTRVVALLSVALLLTLLVAVLAIQRGRGEDTPRPAAVEPVPAGASPAEDARNLGAWLRAQAR
jgi:serine/threonine-protein kinase